MTFAPRRFGIAAFALGLLPVLALAEPGSTSQSGRAWTDPPAREAAEAKAGPRAETPAPREVPARPATASTPRASARAATAHRPGRATVRTLKAVNVRPTPRVRGAARPVATRRHFVSVSPRLPVAGHDPAFRVVTLRPPAYARPAPMVSYGYTVEAAPARSLVYEDERAARIRQAREAGYLVVRSRSLEFPDGRRLRAYRSYDEDADD
jgi:hypothetical protein